MFKGLFPALVTPFQNGKVDQTSYRKLIYYVLQGGADGLVPNGTTGENPALDDEERRMIISIAVEMSKGYSAKVIAGAGSNNTQRTIELVNDADKLGADAALVITPYYNKPTQKGLIRHFSVIAENSSLPIIVYNVPSRTGVNMKAETTIELSKIPNIIGCKEASGDLMQFAEIAHNAGEGFIMLSGDDGLTLPSLAIGGQGVISVAGNVVPLLMKNMLDAWWDGDVEGAKNIHWKLLPLFKALFVETSPGPCKKALQMMGICSDEVRPPLAPVEDSTAQLLKSVLKDLDFDV